MPSHNQLPVLREILELDAQLAPLLERYEELKAQVREFGPGDYPIAGLGSVKVGSPSIRAPKGVEIRIDPEKWTALPPAYQADLRQQGVVIDTVIFSQARASSVSCKRA